MGNKKTSQKETRKARKQAAKLAQEIERDLRYAGSVQDRKRRPWFMTADGRNQEKR